MQLLKRTAADVKTAESNIDDSHVEMIETSATSGSAVVIKPRLEINGRLWLIFFVGICCGVVATLSLFVHDPQSPSKISETEPFDVLSGEPHFDENDLQVTSEVPTCDPTQEVKHSLKPTFSKTVKPTKAPSTPKPTTLKPTKSSKKTAKSPSNSDR